jgi:hypothetical protein
VEWIAKAIDNALGGATIRSPKPRVVAVTHLKNGGIILELDSAESASEVREKRNPFVQHLGIGWQLKDKLYSAMGKFIPINYDWERPGALDRICEDLGLLPGDIVSARWMVDPAKWRLGQTVANEILKFKEPETTNRAIRDSLIIASKCVPIQLLELEPR